MATKRPPRKIVCIWSGMWGWSIWHGTLASARKSCGSGERVLTYTLDAARTARSKPPSPACKRKGR